MSSRINLFHRVDDSNDLVKEIVEVGGEPRFGSQRPEEWLDLNKERRRLGLPEKEIHLAIKQLNEWVHPPQYVPYRDDVMPRIRRRAIGSLAGRVPTRRCPVPPTLQGLARPQVPAPDCRHVPK